MPIRNEKGYFTKGSSGNPGGRPKLIAPIRDLARSHCPDAIATLAIIMKDPMAPAIARIAAANSLLNRGYGCPETIREIIRHNIDMQSSDIVPISHQLPSEVEGEKP